MNKKKNVFIKLGAVAVMMMLSFAFPGCKISLATMTPDACESNDVRSDAYYYNLAPDVEPQIAHYGRLYALGMKHANLDSEDDVDWYYAYCTAGVQYFTTLRNIGTKDYYIEISHFESENDQDPIYSETTDLPKFSGKSEKYIKFTAPYTGKYYIKVARSGEWVETDTDYFFYFGPRIKQFNIVNLPTGGGVQVIGSSYSTYTSNLLYTFPRTSSIITLRVSDYFTSGYCNNVKKRLRSSTGTYYYNNTSTNTTDHDTMIGRAGVNLSQQWTIGAGCSHNGLHAPFYWSARLNGNVSCVMEPFPGNDID